MEARYQSWSSRIQSSASDARAPLGPLRTRISHGMPASTNSLVTNSTSEWSEEKNRIFIALFGWRRTAFKQLLIPIWGLTTTPIIGRMKRYGYCPDDCRLR